MTALVIVYLDLIGYHYTEDDLISMFMCSEH